MRRRQLHKVCCCMEERTHGMTAPSLGCACLLCAGVVVYSMTDVPLGFGTTAKSTMDARKMDPGGIVVFHQVPRPKLPSSVQCDSSIRLPQHFGKQPRPQELELTSSSRQADQLQELRLPNYAAACTPSIWAS